MPVAPHLIASRVGFVGLEVEETKKKKNKKGIRSTPEETLPKRKFQTKSARFSESYTLYDISLLIPDP